MARLGVGVRIAIGLIALLPAACSGAPTDHAAAKPKPTHSSASPTPRPKPRPQLNRAVGNRGSLLLVNPLTGLPPIPRNRVFAVKIDNTSAGEPQVNVNSADIVYVEEVEGGLTRLVAVFASHLPNVVGPVRSVRLGDPLLLAPYRGVALAFSGGASGVVASVHQTHIVDASAPAHPGAYFRSGAKPAPYNMMVNLQALNGVVTRSAGVQDVGFRWAAQARGLQHAPIVHSFQAQVGNTPINFQWDSRGRRWDRVIDGHRAVQTNGAAISTPNVIVQFCQIVTDRRDVDVAGNPSADTKPVGSGQAVIFRDGRMLKGRWVRVSPHAQTHFLSASGQDIPLEPGGAWVLLAPRGSAVNTH